MTSAKFSINYSILVAATGAIFCFIIAPFTDLQWTPWLLLNGLFLCLITFSFLVAEHVTDETSPGLRNGLHLLAVLTMPPLTVVVLAVIPTLHLPVIAWLIPGPVLFIAWAAAAFSTVGDLDDEMADDESDKRDRPRIADSFPVSPASDDYVIPATATDRQHVNRF